MRHKMEDKHVSHEDGMEWQPWKWIQEFIQIQVRTDTDSGSIQIKCKDKDAYKTTRSS